MKITVRFVCEECELESIRNNHNKAEKLKWEKVGKILRNVCYK